jgi:4-amino-4-deoxy-L-arabinose transferase-like glycosyltransferase
VTTSYICFAQRFNANTVLLSLWPATTLAVLRAVERDRLRDGFAAGLLVAFCMLSKYQSAIFLATLLAAVYFLKGSARPYYSRAALICYAAAAIGVVPHLIWLQQNDYLPLRYMRVTTLRGFPTVVRESIVFVLASAGYMAPAVILYQWAGRAQWRRLVRALASGFRDKRLPLAIVTFGAAALTIAICLIRSGTLKTTYAIPMYFMLPFWLAMAPDLPFSAVALRRLRLVVAGILFACLAAAPLIGLVSFKLSTRLATRPKDEIVDAVTDAWHRHYGKPLRIVGGDEDYAISAPFYSNDHPSYLIGLDQRALDEFHLPMSQGPADFVPRLSPWVTAADIERDGLAIICSDEHWDWSTGCEAQAAKWLGDRGIELKMIAAEKDSLFPGLPYRFKIFFIPPK